MDFNLYFPFSMELGGHLDFIPTLKLLMDVV